MRVASSRLIFFALSLWSCSSKPADGVRRSSDVGAPPALPRNATTFAPAQLEVVGHPTGSLLADVGTCENCHADVAAQWHSSAHALASFNNPIYRYAVERFRSEVGKPASHFCGGCHDVALLVDGAMDREVEPGDIRGRTGIACRVCHGATTTRPDGNGSLTLGGDPIPPPREGDVESVRVHKERAALGPLRTSALCGACHRSFLGESTGNPFHLTGMDEVTAWSQSIYGGSKLSRIDDEPVAAKDCRECHMPKENAPLGDAAAKGGKVASHRFLGAHTWLASMRDDAPTLGKLQERLAGAATVDLAAVWHADGSRDLLAEQADVRPGEELTLDVVVRNVAVGHRFPGGTLDAQKVWLEVEVRDASGRTLADAGTVNDETDPTRHLFRAVQADEHGVLQLARETHKFRTVVYNHAIAPRDAEVVRYRFTVPDGAAAPLELGLRLRHQTRNDAVARAACRESESSRGAKYDQAELDAGGKALDACPPPPTTDVATMRVIMGAPRTPVSGIPPWRRLYAYALGLLHGPQEVVDDARAPLERALLSVDTRQGRAAVTALLAQLAVAEGRTAEALQRIDAALCDAPDHPALSALRASALGSVWRWQEAIDPLRLCTQAAPRDSLAWTRLAVAAGSAGDTRVALDACAHGLALQPRDADMLRVQALALEKIGVDPTRTAAARDAYLAFRPPDDAPAIRGACARSVPGCARERLPVHVHEMRVVR
jgi:tetratricopeptide (TPR) repeat protein